MRTYKNTYISQSGRFKPLGSQKRICSALTILLLFCSVINAEPEKFPVQAGEFVRITEDVSLPAGAALQFESGTYEKLRGHNRIRLTGFPLTKRESVDLELEKFEVTTPSTIIVEGTAEGDKPVPHPEVVLFRGRVAGVEDSEAVIGISPYGNNGYIRKGQLLYYLAPDRKPGKAGRTDLHSIAEQLEITGGSWPKDYPCDVKQNPDFVSAEEIFDCMWDIAPPPPPPYDWRVAFVAVECDNEYLDHFGGDVGAALAYVLQLAGTSSHFFERDIYIKWYLSYIRIWTTTDPYPDYVDPNIAFASFAYYWQANMDHIDRDLALQFSCKTRTGLSMCPSLCDYDIGYTINYDLQGWFPRPVQDLHADNWDLHVVPHEAGHTFGSHHTHCYKPAIDSCPPAGSDGDNPWCQGRTDFNDCVPGTIMSYCGGDNCGGYANEIMSFHPRVVRCIREYVDFSDCIRHGMNPVYADWSNTGDEDGSPANPFNTVAEAVQVVIPNGTVNIGVGVYRETETISVNPHGFTIDRPVTLRTTGGMVTIGG